MPFRRMVCCSFVLSTLAILITRSAQAAPVVPGFERFHTDAKSDAATGGRILLGELNCTSCHAADKPTASSLLKKQAPILDGIGSRVNVTFLRKFLTDPQAVKPGTTMPAAFAGLPEADRKQRVEALVHFLATTGSFHHTLPNIAAVSQGENLFHEVGCVACHGSQKPGFKNPAPVVPLGKPGEKYNVRSLTDYLRNPLHTRPSGRMPSLNLTPPEANAIASWFLRDVQVPANLTFKYYEGRWANLPDFSKIKPRRSGAATGFRAKVVRRNNNYAIRYEGFLQVQKAGEYTFFTNSDDASNLYIDGKLVVNNDGEHAPQLRTGKAKLTAGPHAIIVDFAQLGGGAELSVQYQGPGVARQDMASAITSMREPPKPERGFEVDPALVAKGRELFATAGCASCHQLKEKGKSIASRLTAKPLTDLRPNTGCVAATPTQKTPFFGLSARQRESIAAAVKTKPADSTPATLIAHTMTAMNCYACHTRNKVGGPVSELDLQFQTTTKEMGEEGRIPPALDGVGDKLTDAWMKHVLDNGANDRPYMLTRMPKFGLSNVGHLVDAFVKSDRKTLVKMPTVKATELRLKASGRHLVGDKAFACIKCHSFGKYKATGIQSLDLTQMTTRIREDWFFRYMMKPIRYRPGTRMPTPFPGGITTLPDILDGTPDSQLVGIWTYLKDGPNARTPEGLIRGAIQLKPTTEPIIYRNFIQGISPRGIGVGYPGGMNLAFDADRVVLGLLWHGAFIDAGKHWTGRGQGFQGPLGDHLLTLPREFPFATLESIDTKWPDKPAREQGYKFIGYRLNKDRQPIFRYRIGGLEIEDFPQPMKGVLDPSLKRTFTLRSKSEKPALLYLAASGSKIEPLKDGWYQIDGNYRVRVSHDAKTKPIIRKQGSRFELLVPVTFDGNTANVVQEYVW